MKALTTLRYTALLSLCALIFSCNQPSQQVDIQIFGTPEVCPPAKTFFEAHPERTACVYHHYEAPTPSQQPQLPGYEPFYISHYGRHGCRWHTSSKHYTQPLELLRTAKQQGALTPLGDSLLQNLEIIAEDAFKRSGDLSPRGAQEHRGIAERMYQHYPQVFETRNGKNPNIESRSTTVVRCVLSMAAFNERLKELNPKLLTTRQASRRYHYYLDPSERAATQYKAAKAMSDSLWQAWPKPQRFVKSILNDPQFLAAQNVTPQTLMRHIYLIASILQDVSYLNISLYHLFTADELYDLWRCLNAQCYLTMGASLPFGDNMLDDVKALLQNIVETAQAVIDGTHNVAATLRFGHDSDVIPLTSLMGIAGADARVPIEQLADVWNVAQVTPMAANVQFIFFRNNKQHNDIRVRVLLNERDAQLPIQGAPFYKWNELEQYLMAKYQ